MPAKVVTAQLENSDEAVLEAFTIVAASLKGVAHFDMATAAGASYAACPFPLLKQLIHHSATDASIEGFRKDWDSIPKA